MSDEMLKALALNGGVIHINGVLKYIDPIQREQTPLSVFIDHIDYVVKLVGIDYVGIGSDYDGLNCLPKEMTDCQDHILIAKTLEHRGYKISEIEKIMGLNFLRVFKEIKP